MKRMSLLIVLSAFFAACSVVEAADTPCAITNCHGLEIACGEKAPDFCTKMYVAGDLCRSLASCQRVDGVCQPHLSEEFLWCAACVRECQQQSKGGEQFFQCERGCLPTSKGANQDGEKRQE